MLAERSTVASRHGASRASFVIELIVAGAVGATALAGGIWNHRHTKKKRAELAAARGLTVVAYDRLRGQDVDVHFTSRSSGKSRVAYTVLTFPALQVPRDFSLGKEGLFAAEDWQLGDVAFDRAVKVAGDRRYLAYALGPEQRSALLSLIDGWKNARFELSDGTLTVKRDGHRLEDVDRMLDTARALIAHFSAPSATREAPLVARATADPLSEVRAAAVEALHTDFPAGFAQTLPKLRTDAAPRVLLAVALATREAQDVRAVPLEPLTDAQRRQLWDRCGEALDRDGARQLVALTASESDAALYAEALVSTDASALVAHRFEPVRLVAVRWLAEHGDVSAVAPLRALEKSSLFARAQVKACRVAIAAIQRRAGVLDAGGSLSVDEDSAGALSNPDDES